MRIAFYVAAALAWLATIPIAMFAWTLSTSPDFLNAGLEPAPLPLAGPLMLPPLIALIAGGVLWALKKRSLAAGALLLSPVAYGVCGLLWWFAPAAEGSL